MPQGQPKWSCTTEGSHGHSWSVQVPDPWWRPAESQSFASSFLLWHQACKVPELLLETGASDRFSHPWRKKWRILFLPRYYVPKLIDIQFFWSICGEKFQFIIRQPVKECETPLQADYSLMAQQISWNAYICCQIACMDKTQLAQRMTLRSLLPLEGQHYRKAQW